MSNATLAAIFTPIVAGIVLAAWLTAVLRADTHPTVKHHGRLPGTEVSGGAFQANDGGRQLMPIPGQRPAPTAESETSEAGVHDAVDSQWKSASRGG